MLLRSDEKGQVAVIVAICLLPLLFLAGTMIDFSRQQGLERKSQAALDHAAISVALHLQEDENATEAELVAIAQQVFDGNLTQIEGFRRETISVSRNGQTATLNFTGGMQTGLGALMGVDELEFNVESGVQYAGEFGQVALIPLDLVLVLDASLSMQGQRIDELRGAANELVDQVLGDSPGATDTAAANVRMSVVPFNTFVNVGLSQEGESWLSGTEDDTTTNFVCELDQTALTAAGCTVSEVCSLDPEIPCQTQAACPAGVDATQEVCTPETVDRTWNGCVGIRQAPLDVTDGSYTNDPILGALDGPFSNCRPENAILQLTADAGVVRGVIDNITPVAGTYIAAGVSWGQRVLSQQTPFPSNDGGTLRTKGLILMSDGANSRAVDAQGLPFGSDLDDANERFLAACEAAKLAGTQVFTVAFQVDDIETERLLRDCASSADATFDASGERELTDAFLTIASNFTQITLVD